jgi:ribokinase
VKIAVIGHVEHITIGAAPALPVGGDILHLAAPRAFAGGGGGVAAFQLARSDAAIALYTAVGSDDAGRFIAGEIARAPTITAHVVTRAAPHTRDLVLVTPDGQRTIVVIGEPLHPMRADDLPWADLATCDAAYFTAQDPAALAAARAARVLVVTARRRAALIAAGVRADVVVGSRSDPRELSALADYPIPPTALVLTDGARGGTVETAAGIAQFPATPAPSPLVGTYGAGDSFAGALTYFLARGLDPLAAATRAARYGAAVLAALVPLDAQLPLVPDDVGA